ncbi:endolytic transglycosylase MltG [Williamsia sterculiae]|uniref:Endolytic murein transglycosylase n=1 Tax=Williamsia sterculiae TaxID=1344003 RepID=A0A1N7EHG4_9NOCA|nr:endolytic transglycosylase MltG [Williamsia sterculiae]SIR87517.1 UPF0755 protein [Williamsia sterculiae]
MSEHPRGSHRRERRSDVDDERLRYFTQGTRAPGVGHRHRHGGSAPTSEWTGPAARYRGDPPPSDRSAPRESVRPQTPDPDLHDTDTRVQDADGPDTAATVSSNGHAPVADPQDDVTRPAIDERTQSEHDDAARVADAVRVADAGGVVVGADIVHGDPDESATEPDQDGEPFRDTGSDVNGASEQNTHEPETARSDGKDLPTRSSRPQSAPDDSRTSSGEGSDSDRRRTARLRPFRAGGEDLGSVRPDDAPPAVAEFDRADDAATESTTTDSTTTRRGAALRPVVEPDSDREPGSDDRPDVASGDRRDRVSVGDGRGGDHRPPRPSTARSGSYPAPTRDSASRPVEPVHDSRPVTDIPRRRPTDAGASRREQITRKRRRGAVLAVALVVMLAVVGGVAYLGLERTGFFVNDDDYSNTAGTSDVLVQIPADSTLTDFGRILQKDKVVGSVKAFTDAADGRGIEAGYYRLRTEIPAKTAVSMLGDSNNRVGRLSIPAGRQLDTKPNADGTNNPGLFALIADAMSYEINGDKHEVTIEQLAQAAATASPEELGVPDWATSKVRSLTGDHRRVEGLIAPVSWEAVDPDETPVQVLHTLISGSAEYFQQWGLDDNASGLSPYDTLTAASIVEKEASGTPEQVKAKVARVILNRLKDNQRLEMDSTANYTAAVQNIDVAGDAYSAPTQWNTYQRFGLPATPVGSVGQDSLTAAANPPQGNWLFFVTVDRTGKTLFADNYEDHKRNREQACRSGLLTVGCD